MDEFRNAGHDLDLEAASFGELGVTAVSVFASGIVGNAAYDVVKNALSSLRRSRSSGGNGRVSEDLVATDERRMFELVVCAVVEADAAKQGLRADRAALTVADYYRLEGRDGVLAWVNGPGYQARVCIELLRRSHPGEELITVTLFVDRVDPLAFEYFLASREVTRAGSSAGLIRITSDPAARADEAQLLTDAGTWTPTNLLARAAAGSIEGVIEPITYEQARRIAHYYRADGGEVLQVPGDLA